MNWRLSFLILACCVAFTACRTKPKKNGAYWPSSPPAVVGHSGKAEPRPADIVVEPVKKNSEAPAEQTPPASAPPVGTATNSHPISSSAQAGSGGSSSSPSKATNEKSTSMSSGSSRREEGAVAAEESRNSPSSRRGLPDASLVSPAGDTTRSLPLGILPVTDSHAASARVGAASLSLSVAGTQPATDGNKEALRAPLPAPGTTQPASTAKNISLWSTPGADQRNPTTATGSRGLSLPDPTRGATTSSSLSTPLAAKVATGTNMPSAKIDPSKPIPIDPLLKQGEGTNWREQQLAKQAAEQKAREEEQRKLQNALHRFLFKDDAAR